MFVLKVIYLSFVIIKLAVPHGFGCSNDERKNKFKKVKTCFPAISFFHPRHQVRLD